MYLTGTLSFDKMHLTGTIPVNKVHLTGTGYLDEKYVNGTIYHRNDMTIGHAVNHNSGGQVANSLVKG